MSLTFPAAYSAKLHSSAVDVDWLFHFINDNAGLVYLSSVDRTVGSNNYYGVIEDPGEITREIDLLNCTASIGEISISCADHYKTGSLSGELLHNGTDHYINQKVLIYECVDNETTLANCPLLYEGRLKEIDIQGNGCVLTIEQWTPFDHIMTPDEKTTNGKIFEPIIYGEYTANVSDAYASSINLRPAPQHIVSGILAYYAGETNMGTGALHLYDGTLKQFIPTTETSNSVVNGVNSKKLAVNTQRDFYFRPSAVDSGNTDMVADTGSLTDIIDDDSTPSTSFGAFITDAGQETLVLDIPQIEGIIEFIDVRIYGYISVPTESGTSTATVDVSIDGGTTWNQIEQVTSTPGSSAAWRTTGDIVSDLSGANPEFREDDASGDNCPDVRIRITNVTDGTIQGNYYFYDIALDVHMSFTYPRSGVYVDFDTVYFGDNGPYRNYTDGGGGGTVASEVQEIHRALMNVYGGVDYDNDYMVNWIAASPGAYDLDAARDGWKARLWLLDPVPLKEVLEKLQFEGCFIFMLKADADGSGTAGGRYVWIQDSYSSGDVVQTLTEADYDNFSIGHTDVFEIITKSVYNFDRNPIDNDYRSQSEYDNTAETTNWNLGSSHLEQIDLDFLVGSANGTDEIYDSGAGDNTANESIALYRDALQSEPKIMADCEITNKKKSDLEVGDIIQFNDSNVNPYGETWSNIYFMIVSERRSKQILSITAKEVYRT